MVVESESLSLRGFPKKRGVLTMPGIPKIDCGKEYDDAWMQILMLSDSQPQGQRYPGSLQLPRQLPARCRRFQERSRCGWHAQTALVSKIWSVLCLLTLSPVRPPAGQLQIFSNRICGILKTLRPSHPCETFHSFSKSTAAMGQFEPRSCDSKMDSRAFRMPRKRCML